MTSCYCGNPSTYENCCEPIISGNRQAETAEQLMRARFSAYATAEIDFLHDSLHPDGRAEFDFDATKQWAENSQWLSLNILDSKAGTASDKVGTVDFIATYVDADSKEVRHAERSHFKRVSDQWYFSNATTN